MKNLIWLTLDDLIFEGRNKLYGAYALRKEYPRHLAIALSVVFVFAGLSIPLPQYLNKNTTLSDVQLPAKPEDKVIEIVLPNIEDKPGTDRAAYPVAPATTTTVVTPTNTTAVITLVDDAIAATDVIPNNQIVTSGETGNATNAGATEITGTTTGTETGPGSAETYVEPKIENFAEIMPRFPGGDAALARQINQLMRYPGEAVKAGIAGTVYVSFVVDPKGNVSRIKVEKGIGGGCDEEAIRVISQLKGWSPAIQNGNPVFFKYVMPVRFVIR